MDPGRLSLAAAEPLVRTVAASIDARMRAKHAGWGDEAGVSRWTSWLAGMNEDDLLELARFALNASLEVLDADPFSAAGLLPRATSVIQAQIARGCMADAGAHAQGYMVAEIDIDVWEQLLDADRRTSEMDSLSKEELADRRRRLLVDLGISADELILYRDDRRVAMALPELTEQHEVDRGVTDQGNADEGRADRNGQD